MQTSRLSSNLTLFFKFFVPVLWSTLVGCLLAAVWLLPAEQLPVSATPSLRWGLIFFFLTGLALFGLVLLPLKRIEADAHFVYVTNYFRAARYPWHNVQGISETGVFGLGYATVFLREGGTFGRRMRFLSSSRKLRKFYQAHAELGDKIQLTPF